MKVIKWMTETQHEAMVLVKDVEFLRKHPTLAIKKFLEMSKSYEMDGMHATMKIYKETLRLAFLKPLTDPDENEIQPHITNGTYNIKKISYVDGVVNVVCDAKWITHAIEVDNLKIMFVIK